MSAAPKRVVIGLDESERETAREISREYPAVSPEAQRWLRARSLCQPRPALLLWPAGASPDEPYEHEIYSARYGSMHAGYVYDEIDAGRVLVELGLTPWATAAERAAPALTDSCWRDGACDGSCDPAQQAQAYVRDLWPRYLSELATTGAESGVPAALTISELP